jgi:DNA repair exonuclease SbcCD nuclease subunit
MKIFIYSDLHISKTSSILPIHYSDKYTYRQNMIIETGKFLADVIRAHQPDLIINLGDTFDQHTITSYDVEVASEFFKNFDEFENIPHLVVVGNHEMINTTYNAVALLNNIPNIEVISQAGTKEINGEKLAFLPYCDYTDLLSFPEGTYLFSHQDIQGSIIRGDFALPEGISPAELKNHYKLIFNGHIHKPSILGNVINAGSVSTHSFSDDEDSVPQCYLFDTQTMDLKTFKIKTCPLFRKIGISYSLNELNQFLANLDADYKYIIQCTCPHSMREDVKQILADCSIVVNSRINTVVDKAKENTADVIEEFVTLANIDIKKSFEEFLNIQELKFPRQMYLDILEGVKVNEL